MSETVPETLPNAPLPLHKLSNRALTILWVVVGCTLVAGCVVIGSAFTPGTTNGERVLLLAAACFLLLLPGRIAFVSVRRRVRTGTWKITEEERRANRAKWVSPKAEKLIKRMDVWFAVISLMFTLLSSITAAEMLRNLVHSRFHGVDAWFYAIFWMLLAVYWFGVFFRMYVKRRIWWPFN